MITNKYLGTGLEALGGWITASAQTGANFSRMGLPLGDVVKNTGQILKNLLGMVAGPVLKGVQSIGTSLGGSKLGKGASTLKDKLLKGVGSKTPEIPKNANVGGKGSITDSISKIDPKKVLAGAAALVIVAGAVWVFGKAVQEFMQVSWSAVGKAVVSMAALIGAVLLLGTVMSSGMIVPLLAGAAAMVIVAGSMWILGKAIQEMATGFAAMGQISEILSGLVTMIPGIVKLTAAFAGLAFSLSALGVAGLMALPALMGLSLATPALTTMAKIFGVDDSSKTTETTSIVNDTISEYEVKMLGKMDILIKAVSANKDVYLDKEKVTSIVTKTSEKATGNVFGLGVA